MVFINCSNRISLKKNLTEVSSYILEKRGTRTMSANGPTADFWHTIRYANLASYIMERSDLSWLKKL